jgi:hypothetical protein
MAKQQTMSFFDRKSIIRNNSVMKAVANRPANKKTRSFSLDADVLSDIDRTKGSASASEHVNQLLRFALEMERKASLEQEAAEFFRTASEDRDERRAFQRANSNSWARE